MIDMHRIKAAWRRVEFWAIALALAASVALTVAQIAAR